jgi:hypothetical protein
MENPWLIRFQTQCWHQLVDVVWAVHHLKKKELIPPSAIQGRYVSCMSRCMCKDRGQLELVGMRVLGKVPRWSQRWLTWHQNMRDAL